MEVFLLISALSFTYLYVKDTYYDGSLTRLKVETESQSQTFIYKINTKDRHLNKTSAFDQ